MNRCPRCNSADADILQQQQILGREMRLLRCNRCARRWRRFIVCARYSFPSVCLCPACHERGRVVSTQGATRYMVCSVAGCAARWKVLGELT